MGINTGAKTPLLEPKKNFKNLEAATDIWYYLQIN